MKITVTYQNKSYILDVEKAKQNGSLTPAFIHKVGNHYKHILSSGESVIFVLASTGDGLVQLIDIDEGGNYSGEVDIDDIYKISDDEWELLTEGDAINFVPVQISVTVKKI